MFTGRGTLLLMVATALAVNVATADVFVPQHQQQRNNGARGRKPSYGYSTRKPNIVLILTDDQDVELGSMNFMPKTLRTIKHKGAECRHAYVTTPMCCPSRSSLLTGMYVHNHNVFTNNDNCSSTHWQTYHETRSFATYLSNAGYRTGYFGKYLNKYNGSYIPPGWREWGGLIMNSKYYNYSINMNGKKIKHGFDYHKDYYPDLIVNDSIAFLRQSKKNSANKPVMLTMSFPAPHGPEDSAPQYSHLFFNVTTHHTPSYDHAPNPDKQWILQITNKMKPIHKQFTDLLMTKRLQTLQSVDSAVQRVVDELERLGELDNTFIVYTSDHGYHLGQFGLIKGKSFPFEFDVRVPFLVRGPGVEPGTVIDDIVLNIDLAPTFLDMAGVELPPHMDGRSVLPLFLNRGRRKWPDTFLIESSGRRDTPDSRKANKYSATSNGYNLTTPQPSTGFEESTSVSTSATAKPTTPFTRKFDESGEEREFDDDHDGTEQDENPDETENDDEEENDEEVDSEKVNDMQNIDNNQLLPDVTHYGNKSERLARECSQDEFKLPCKVGQKWYCEYQRSRWRKHKCKTHLKPNKSKTYKKCACFTSEKLVYKKLPVVNAGLSSKRTHRLRTKRDVKLDDIVFNHLHPDNTHKLTRRVKRDSLEHVDSVLASLQDQLTGLQKVNATLREVPLIQKTNIETNTIDDIAHGCVRVSKGNVNCTMEVYNNRKTWKKERQHIETEIQRLKHELESLKEIRRHLKHAKPYGEDDKSDEVVSTESSNNIVDNSLSYQPIDNTQRKRKDSPKRRQHHLDFNGTDFDFDNFTNENFNSGWPNSFDLTTHRPTRHNHTNRFHPTRRRSHHESTADAYSSSTLDIFRTTAKSKFTTPRPNFPQQEHCYCEHEEEEDLEKEKKRKLKEERLSKKARKLKKKMSLEKECLSEKVHCFRHDNDHWKTAPLWTAGPFCVCMNANNNTYNCLRTINATHNLLYCEFVTGMVTYYNLRMDPFELQNRADALKPEERSYLHDQLKALMACRGKDCTVHHNQLPHRRQNQYPSNFAPNPNVHRPKKRRYDEYNAARTLPLQSEYSSRPQYDPYNNRPYKAPKPWRRRKAWEWRQVRERERRKHNVSPTTNTGKKQWY